MVQLAVICLFWYKLSLFFCLSSIFSAKRGIAIACRPSVCPSATLVDQDHTCWKAWKLIARIISPTPSLFVAQKPFTYSVGTWGNFGETRGGVGKNGVLEHINGNISETR